MIILSKKRIYIMLSMVMVAVLAFSFKVADSEKTVQTMSLPVSNKVIVLDARPWNTR
ncbi:MAG: hypothetical protein U0M05_05310 [Clostridia bacterium]|jgi:hypothetical protein|nr:hypothetical protein [Clostridia bacterium]